MELVAHRAMASEARLRRRGGATELRLVAQATFLLVSGPTAIADAEELDEEAAGWLDRGAIPDGAAVMVVGAGASRVTAEKEVVLLGADGRGDRRLPRGALGAGASLAVETADAGAVATRLPADGPRAWLELEGGRRALTLEPIAVRIDLVGLRFSVMWCATAPIDAASEDARLVVHTDAAPSDDAPRSTRPPPAARTVPRVDSVIDDPPTPVVRVDTTQPEWDVDSTVSIDGPAVGSVPLPFQPGVREPAEAREVVAASPEKRSIGQLMVQRGLAPTRPAEQAPKTPTIDADPSRAGRGRMGEGALEAPRPAARAAARPAERVAPMMLLHVEPGASAKLRRAPAWRAILQAPSRAAQRAADETGDDKAAARDARDAVMALRCEPTPAGGIAAELARGVDDGLFVAPVLVVEGELELPLDETALLRATVDAVSPLRGADRRVEEALDRARPFLEASWLDPAVAEAERSHLRGVVASLGRGHTADALDAQVDRKLRRDRIHVTRAWRGAPWVVAILVTEGTRLSALLPRAAVDLLPIARRFRARLLVEAQPSIEPEADRAPTLFALAVARELAEPAGRA